MDLTEVLDFAQWAKDVILLNSKAVQASARHVDRGQVYWCKLGMGVGSEERKIRPCVIIQNNGANRNSPNVIVAPITHSASKLDTVVQIETYADNDNNIILDGYAMLGNIVCTSKARLGNLITKLTREDMEKIDKAIAVSTYIYHHYEKLERKYADKLIYIEKLKQKIIESDTLISKHELEIKNLKKAVDDLLKS